MAALASPLAGGRTGLVPGTPCTTSARACVNLTDQRAWLIADGKVVRGPVRIHSGGPDRATPQGTFTVSWKDKDHVSKELAGMPMPDAVFFAAGGIAFHQGPLTSASAGCVHLSSADATAFYTALRRGDQVQVRAPGGDPASGAPAGAPNDGPAAPSGSPSGAGLTVMPNEMARTGGGRVQPGIPGVSAIGPAPRD
jgi:hypothetical protein